MKFKHILIILLLLQFCYPSQSNSETKSEEESILLEVLPSRISKNKNDSKVAKYLTGQYKSTELLKQYDKYFYLRAEVLEKYKEMLKAYQEYSQKNEEKELPKMYISSAFRKYEQQKRIWERKFKKYKKELNESEEMDDTHKSDTNKTEKIISRILEYSSAPGTSRHHWGTDFDINILENYYYETDKGKGLYEWLSKNAKKYGFCQPYNKYNKRNNKGYYEEKWHWSYYPISNHLQKEWVRLYEAKKITLSGFKGAELMNKRAMDYVNSINQECFQFEEDMEHIPEYNEEEDGALPIE